MSRTPEFTAEQVYPAYQRMGDALVSAMRSLRKTPHATGVPHTLGDDMRCCQQQLSCSGFLPKLEAKRPTLMAEGAALLLRFNTMIEAGEVVGTKALIPA